MGIIHVLGETVKVLLLLLELLLELNELLLLTLADSVILAGLLTSLESITKETSVRIAQSQNQLDFGFETHPEPPVGRGAPVAPSVMTRGVVEKHRMGRKAAAWRKDVRSMIAK